jgi:hypothetical protein
LRKISAAAGPARGTLCGHEKTAERGGSGGVGSRMVRAIDGGTLIIAHVAQASKLGTAWEAVTMSELQDVAQSGTDVEARPRDAVGRRRAAAGVGGSGVSAPAAPPPEVPPQPPFANRGVATSHPLILSRERGLPGWAQGVGGIAWRPGVDFLTLSMPEAVGGLLVGETELEEAGSPRPGFKSSERRVCLGGSCWRRWEPHQPAKGWGLGYESWEWEGDAADGAAGRMRDRESRASRADVEFTYACEPGLTACQVVDAWRDPAKPEKTREGFVIGASGDEPWLTRYVGASSSERRVRVYRWDRKHLWLGGIEAPPLLRVELVLKGEHARSWWRAYQGAVDEGRRVAAAHVHAMTGVRLVTGSLEVPEREPDAVADVASDLFEFMEQNAGKIAAFEAAGVDVIGLARERAESARRETVWRMKQRVKRLKRAGPERVVDAVRSMMGARAKRLNA